MGARLHGHDAPLGRRKAPANFISADELPTRLRPSYGPIKYERLVTLKNAYDPANVFALNQNIPPHPRPAYSESPVEPSRRESSAL